MKIRVLFKLLIASAGLLSGTAMAFQMHLPQNLAPAYVPASAANGVASFIPNYRRPMVVNLPWQQVNRGYPQWQPRLAGPARGIAPWPFPISYRPSQSPVTSYTYPTPYRSYSSGLYRQPMQQAAFPGQQMPFRPGYAGAVMPPQSGRGFNMANVYRGNNMSRWSNPRQQANPRAVQMNQGRYPQPHQPQRVTSPRMQQLAANGYHFRPMREAQRYRPAQYAPQMNRGNSPLAARFRPPVGPYVPQQRSAPNSRWQQPGPYAQRQSAGNRYGQPYRYRPDARFTNNRPAQAWPGYAAPSRYGQKSNWGGYRQAVRNAPVSNWSQPGWGQRQQVSRQQTRDNSWVASR